MRSVEQQEKMIQEARDNQWTVGIAILNSGLRVSDQEDLQRIVQCYSREDALNLYWGLDTVIRDRFMDIIDDALYGSQRVSDEQNDAECSFTQDELNLLSQAILCAIQANNTAAKMTVSPRAVTIILNNNDDLQALNNKICGMMEEE